MWVWFLDSHELSKQKTKQKETSIRAVGFPAAYFFQKNCYARLFHKDEQFVNITDYSLECPKGKRSFFAYVTFVDKSYVLWDNFFTSNRAEALEQVMERFADCSEYIYENHCMNLRIEPPLRKKTPTSGVFFCLFLGLPCAIPLYKTSV